MKKVLVIAGPTASGKTAISTNISKLINVEIISADSRQIYKHISIATSAPTKIDTELVIHHFIEELEPEEEFNAGEFGKEGRKRINEIFSKNNLPLIVGGSGLYIRSLIDGFFRDEIKNKEICENLYKEYKEKGESYLYKKLIEVDPKSAETMDETKYRRVIRALEVYYSTGKRISDLQLKNVSVDFESVQFGLMLNRNYLYDRINSRVEQMIADGLIDEVKNLAEKGYHFRTHNSLNTVGIQEVFRFFDNELSYEEMVELIKKNTRNYAKRQLTWFRKDKRINWVDISEHSNLIHISKIIVDDFLKLI